MGSRLWIAQYPARRTMSCRLYVLAIVLTLTSTCQGADILAASKIQSCYANSSQTIQTLQCSQKLVVTLSLDSGDTTTSSTLQFSVNCVNNTDGVCPCTCSYITDPGCTCRDLQQQVAVTLTKSPLWASYPLTYLQSFNYKPYEKLIYVESGTCKDGGLEPNPTCGWYYVAAQKQPDSQGFCCDCTLSNIWDSTFGQSTQKSRAGLDCDFFSDPFSGIIGRYPSSASCLEFDPQWYGGYALGEAMLDFSITVTVQYTNATSNTTASEVATLSPSVPVALTSGGFLAAKLLGDLAGYTQLPVLSSKLLMIPRPLPPLTLQNVLNNRTAWMLVDRSMISFDGNHCDMVGTSFAAFRYHSDRCKRAPQTCLSNQLRDLLQGDKQRIAQGKVPLYLISQYTYGLSASMQRSASNGIAFALPVPFKRSSIVTLEAAADALQLVTNVSPGKLSGAAMCQFSGTVCGGFEASASHGFLHANVTNAGSLAAAYTLSITNCSANIRPVEAQRLGLKAGQSVSITPFEIYVEDDKAQTSRYCWLVLFDAQARRTDQLQVIFYTNATVYAEIPTGGTNATGSDPRNQTARDCSACQKGQMSCFVKNRCWSKFGGMIGWMGAALVGVLLLLLALKAGWLAVGAAGAAWLFSRATGGGGSSTSSRSKRRSERFAMHSSNSGHQSPNTGKSSTGGKQLEGSAPGSAAGGAAGHSKPAAGPRASSATGRALFDSASGWQSSKQQGSSRSSRVKPSKQGQSQRDGLNSAAVNPLFDLPAAQEGLHGRDSKSYSSGGSSTDNSAASSEEEHSPEVIARVVRRGSGYSVGSKGPPSITSMGGNSSGSRPGARQQQQQQQQQQSARGPQASSPEGHQPLRPPRPSSSGQRSPFPQRQLQYSGEGTGQYADTGLCFRRTSSTSSGDGDPGMAGGYGARFGATQWQPQQQQQSSYHNSGRTTSGPVPAAYSQPGYSMQGGRPPMAVGAPGSAYDRSGPYPHQQKYQQQPPASMSHGGWPGAPGMPRSSNSSPGGFPVGPPGPGYRVQMQSAPGGMPPMHPGYMHGRGASSPGGPYMRPPAAAVGVAGGGIAAGLARPVLPAVGQRPMSPLPGRAHPAAAGARPAGHFAVPQHTMDQ